MKYKSNTLSQSLPIDAQKDALPIKANSPRAKSEDPGVPSGGNPWYAVLATSEDDWSKGSFDIDEAKAMAREIRKKHPGAMIAIIDNSLDYPFCSDTITDF
jgi:hypothetical protein